MADPYRAVTAARQGSRRPIQIVATLVGMVFLVAGVSGFVPTITTHYDQLHFAGHMSGALLLGVFSVSVLHNVVHLAFGVLGVLAGFTEPGARAYLLLGGLAYLGLSFYGLMILQDSPVNFVPINTPDNWLHLTLSVVMLGGLALGRTDRPTLR